MQLSEFISLRYAQLIQEFIILLDLPMYALKAKKFIKNTEQVADYQCKICFEVSEQPVYCKGPCHLTLCGECTSQIKKNYGKCPQRCSNPLTVEPFKNVPMEFSCPFNSELCKEPLSSLQLFKGHIKKCEFQTEYFKQKVEHLNNYRCPEGHELFFMTGEGLLYLYGRGISEASVNTLCSNCEEVILCRSICPQCSTRQKLQLFCCKCSRPPCTKTSCLHSHSLKLSQLYEFMSLCDYCGKPSRMYGEKGYSDRTCNFDICQSCYENLPEQHPLVPIKTNLNMSCISHLRQY